MATRPARKPFVVRPSPTSSCGRKQKSAVRPAEHAAIVVLNETRPMPCASSAENVEAGVETAQPNQRIRPPTAPRMMLCGNIGPPPSRANTRRAADRGQPRRERNRAADRVDDGRAREVAERRRHRGEESVRTPGPVADDRIDEPGDADRVEDVADEPRSVPPSRPR